jgi:hypothetical protein
MGQHNRNNRNNRACKDHKRENRQATEETQAAVIPGERGESPASISLSLYQVHEKSNPLIFRFVRNVCLYFSLAQWHPENIVCDGCRHLGNLRITDCGEASP